MLKILVFKKKYELFLHGAYKHLKTKSLMKLISRVD